jgi:ribosomal protein L12E/L44/L45/RPP1/RPP2
MDRIECTKATTRTSRSRRARPRGERGIVRPNSIVVSLIAGIALGGAALAQEAAPPVDPAPQQNAMVRFVHLAPNAEVAGVTFARTDEEGVRLTPEEVATLGYRDATEYFALPAGEYDVTLGTAGAAAADVRDPVATEPPGESVVAVRLRDGEIDMDGEFPAGSVTFEIVNDGSIEHDFAIEGVLDGTNGPLAPGESTTVTVDLEPGDYRAYCPVGDHAEQGMELEFTVTEAEDADVDDGEEAEDADAEAEDAEEADAEAEDADADADDAEAEDAEAEEAAAAARPGTVELVAPALDQTINFRANRYYTVAIIGLVLPQEVLEPEENGGFFAWLRGLFTGDDPADRDALALRFEVIEDDMDAFIEPDATRIRVVHAAPGTASLDVAVAGERGTLARNIDFGDVSRNLNLAAGETMLEVRPTGSRAVALDLADVDLGFGMIHTVFIVGTPIEEVPLEAVVLSDTPIALPVADPVDPMAPAAPAAPAEPAEPADPDPEPEEPADPEPDDEPEEEEEDGAAGG